MQSHRERWKNENFIYVKNLSNTWNCDLVLRTLPIKSVWTSWKVRNIDRKAKARYWIILRKARQLLQFQSKQNNKNVVPYNSFLSGTATLTSSTVNNFHQENRDELKHERNASFVALVSGGKSSVRIRKTISMYFVGISSNPQLFPTNVIHTNSSCVKQGGGTETISQHYLLYRVMHSLAYENLNKGMHKMWKGRWISRKIFACSG